jgi:hypothetical protein
MGMDDTTLDVVLLRDILARELETINFYQSLLARAKTADSADFITHVIDEEKEHVAEAMELINRIDPAQASRFGAVPHYNRSSGDQSANRGIDPGNKPGQFTVGSLRDIASR